MVGHEGKMHTAEHLARVGVCESPVCLIYGLESEDHKHLYFAWHYSRKVIECLKAWLGIGGRGISVQEVTRWIHRSRSSKLQKQVMLAVISAAIYKIWWVRNTMLWLQKVLSVDHSVNFVQRNVVERVYSIMPKKASS